MVYIYSPMRKNNSATVESLEPRQLLHGAFPVNIDFAPVAAPIAGGSIADTGLIYGVRENALEYGWSKDTTANGVSRTATGVYQRSKTYIDMQANGDRTWEIHLHDGQYKLTIGVGDPSAYGGKVNITAEGKTVASGTTTSTSRLLKRISTVTVTDGKLTLANGSDATWNKIGYITIDYVGPVTGPTPTPDPTPAATAKISWTTGTSMPTGKAEAFGGTIGGKMYVFGGYVDKTFRPVDTAHAYNPATKQWSAIANLPMRISHPATAIDSRYIYFAGGYPATSTAQTFATTKVYRYDTQTNTYQSMPDLPQARGAAAGAIAGNFLYIMGGADSSRKDRTEVWALNLSDTASGWLQKKSLPEARNHPAAVTLNGSIHFIGGQTGQDFTSVYKSTTWRYDAANDQWDTLASMSVPRSHITDSTFVYDGKIIAIGGEGTAQAKLKIVESYDPASNKWTTFTSLPSPRFSGIADIINGKIYFAGGFNSTFEKTLYIGTFV